MLCKPVNFAEIGGCETLPAGVEDVRWPTIRKLTCSVRGTNPSPFGEIGGGERGLGAALGRGGRADSYICTSHAGGLKDIPEARDQPPFYA